MYRLPVGEMNLFTSFLNATESGWVNAVFSEGKALLVQNTGELFAVLQLEGSCSNDEQNRVFRVKTEILKLLAVEGFMEFSFGKDSMKVDFIDKRENVQRSVEMPIHQAFVASFGEKLKFLEQGGDRFDALCLKEAIAIARVTNSFLEVNSGILGITERDGTMIYRRVDRIPDLCITAKAASKVMQCSSEWHRAQNFVFAVNKNYAIVATQCRGNGLADVDAILGAEDKSAAVFEVGLSQALSVFRNVHEDVIRIAFREGYCAFGGSDVHYRVLVPVEGLRVSERFTENEVVLRGKVLLEIISKFAVGRVQIQVKRHYLRIGCGDYTVLCRRGSL